MIVLIKRERERQRERERINLFIIETFPAYAAFALSNPNFSAKV